jgi:hypothetical protein
MAARFDRSEWPTVLGGFAIGVLIAIGLVALWLMLTRGTAESFDVAIDSPRTSAADRGLIGSTYTGIAQRLQAERRVVRPVRGDLPFRIAGLVWQDKAGLPAFVRAAELRGGLSTRALQNGDIVVRGLVVRDADVLLEQNERLEWNYKRVMAPLLEPDDDGGRERAFVVTDIAIQNADVRVRSPARSFAIDNIAAQLPRADFAGPGLAAPRVTIARATGTLVVRDSSYGLIAEDARADFPTGRVDFNVARLTSGETRLANVSGSYGGDLPGFAMRVSGDAVHMRFEDVKFANARLPATGTAAFHFRVQPISTAVTEVQLSGARLESQGSKASGSATIHWSEEAMSVEAIDARFDPLSLSLVEQMLGDTLPYQGSISGTARGTDGLVSFDVTTNLVSQGIREPFVSHLTGSARFASGGFEIRKLEADLRDAPLAALRAMFPGLPLKGTITGQVVLTGPPDRAPLDLNVRLELAGGVAIVEGRVDLTGAVPTYDLNGRVIAINMQQLLQPDVPPVFVTARFSVAGSGANPDSTNARLRVDGRFTGWRTGLRDTVHIAARLQNGTAIIESAAITLASMTGSASGSWRFTAPTAGSIEYRVAFEPITPFGPYIPLIGDEDAAGNVSVAGTINGETKRIQVAGDATASNVMVGGWSGASLEGKYSFVIGPQVPEITFDGSGRDLKTPTAGEYQTMNAKVRLQSPIFALEVRADRATGGGGIEIVADGRIPPTGAREVILHRARIDLGADNWALRGPAVFSWAPPRTDLDVRGFALAKSDGNGLLRLEGRVLPLADADFQLETIALPVGDIQELLGRPTRVIGALTTTTTVRTTSGVPQLTTRFQLDNATIENVRFAQLTGDASYEGQKLIANATAVVDTAGSLRLSAELPMDLRLGAERRAKLLESGPVRVTLVSDSIALAPFAALHPDIQDLSGNLSADVRVTGTVEEPLLGGSLAVRNAAVRVIPLNQRFDSIHATIALENRRAAIQDFGARSGGRMRASGSIEFRDLTKPVLDLIANFDGLQPLGADNQTDAGATGEIRLTGPLSAAVLTGNVRLVDGFLPIPQTGTRTLDAELARFESDLPASGEGAQRTSFYRSLRIDDLRVTAGDNLWFSMEDARAELAGTLMIDKNGDALSVVGELEGERGTYTLRAGPIIRRFDVLSAKIRFLGGRDINPALDIAARRRVVDLTGRQLDIEVRIRGTMERPTLALASEGARAIPQSELLSFLLFGQPSVALGGTNLTAPKEIGETYIGGIAELLSMELEQAFIDEMGMGLDIFQIRLGGGRLSNLDRASLVVGEEIGSNLFLTVESGVETLFGGSGSGPAAGAGNATAATFAIHLDWRVTEHTNVRASYEPVNQAGLRQYWVPLLDRKYQGTLELRRRWTW